jgi:hypothetical protein
VRAARLALLLLPLAARADVVGGPAAPLPWSDPAPVARMFLAPPFDSPEPLGPHELSVEARLLYANVILVARSPSLLLDADLESAQLLALFRYGLGGGWELEAGLPLHADSGGFMDGPISWFERTVDVTSMRGREEHRYGIARFWLGRPDGRAIRLDGGGGLGDAFAGLKVRLLDGEGARPTLALRALVKAPTGRPPFGSGEVDGGAGLLAGWRFGRIALRLQLDVVAPTGALAEVALPTRPYATARVGVAAAVGPAVTLHLLASSGTSPLRRTGLGALDAPTHYVVGGASIALSPATTLELGAAENVFSPDTGADFTLLAAVRVAP